jgi:hypothetical protein
MFAEALCNAAGMDSAAYLTPPSELTSQQSGIFANPRRTPSPSADTRMLSVARSSIPASIPARPRATRIPPPPSGDYVHKRLMGSLPKTVFATKLRAFIDSIEAEIVEADDNRTLLFISTGGPNWFSFGSRRKKGLHIEIVSRLLDDGTAQRLIDIRIFSNDPRFQGEQLTVRANRIINSIMSYTMSSEHHG